MDNGRPHKSKPKKSDRLLAIEASFDALAAIANEGRAVAAGMDDDTKHEYAMQYLQSADLPLGEDTADFFVPEEDEVVFLLEAVTEGFYSFLSTLAAMKASAFMHGYMHAQIEDGVRDEAGKVNDSRT